MGGTYNENGGGEDPKNDPKWNLLQYNTRPTGRIRTRWEDVVQRDALQLLGMRRWRRRARNGDEWRHALREARARKGL